MIVIVILGIIAFIIVAAIVTGFLTEEPAAFGFAAAAFIVGLLLASFTMLQTISDGEVGVVQTYGKYSDTTLSPGLHMVSPHRNVVKVDTRIQSYTFSADAEESISGPITAQAAGGGNLSIELTIQTAPSADRSPELLRSVAGDWLNTITLPEVRSCTRDATTDLTVEEAYTTERTLIGERIFECVSTKSDEVGLVVYDVLIRDVDPGQRVKDEIDTKQSAEQALQRAGIELQQKEIEAQQEAVEAFGLSQAEQIVACGGTQGEGPDGEPIIIPNVECEDQFSQEYLQWLYINQLDQIDGVVVVPPEFDDQLFVTIPSPEPEPEPAG